MTKYFTCAETAKLIRQSLKEAFTGVKFSVRSSTYSGGASISVSWTDGPNAAQVESITKDSKPPTSMARSTIKARSIT